MDGPILRARTPFLSAMLRFAIAAVLLAQGAVAQPHRSAERLAEVGRALIAGDSSRAYQIARDASRLDRDHAPLARARLRLEVSPYAESWLPVFARHEQITDVARQLRRLSPQDTLALRVLSVDALWTILTLHDKVLSIALIGGMADDPDVLEAAGPVLIDGRPEPAYGVGRAVPPDGQFIPQEEVRRRMTHSQFELAARNEVTPMLDVTGRAASARARLAGILPAWQAAAPDDARPYLVAAALAALDGDGEALLGAARAARLRQPGRAYPLLLLGTAHARLGNTDEAEAAFDEGIARLPEALRPRFEDITALLTPDEQDAFARDPAGVARAFWARSDPRLFTSANERRAEHYARVVEADLLFTLGLFDFPALFDLPLWPPVGAESERGRVWIRYGRPEATARFTSRRGDSPYGQIDIRFLVWEYPAFRYVFTDPTRRDQYRKFSPPASAFSSAGTAVNDDYVMQDRRLQREMPTQTQVAPSFPLTVLASRFRQPDGDTEVVVAYGVPLRDPNVPPERLDVGVFSVGPGGLADAVRASLRPSAGRVLTASGGAVWPGASTVVLPARAEAVRAEVEVGSVWGAARVPVAPLSRTGFGLSDVLLASAIDEDGDGPVLRDGLSIAPVPWGVFAAGDPIYVYVEAYGLTLTEGRTAYSVEARLVPEARRRGVLGLLLGRGQGPGVAVQSDSEGNRPTESAAFVVDAAGQPPGRYTLQIEVTDRATGATATAERTVLLE